MKKEERRGKTEGAVNMKRKARVRMEEETKEVQLRVRVTSADVPRGRSECQSTSWR